MKFINCFICYVMIFSGISTYGAVSDYDAFFSSNGTYKAYLYLVVDKTKHKANLHLWTENPDVGEIIRRFPVALGTQVGDKQVEGDLRTPEGIYFARSHKDGKSLPEKYGPVAVPLNYPNPIDRLRGKTGHGIWLHGLGKYRSVVDKRVTEGCVGLDDRDMELISKWLAPKSITVVITKDASLINVKSDTLAVRAATRSWLTLLEKQDYGLLGNIVHERYGEDLKTVFSEERQSLKKQNDIRVLTTEDYAISVISSHTGDDSNKALRRKILYWKKNDSQQQYELVADHWDNFGWQPLAFSKADMTRITQSIGSGLTPGKEW